MIAAQTPIKVNNMLGRGFNTLAPLPFNIIDTGFNTFGSTFKTFGAGFNTLGTGFNTFSSGFKAFELPAFNTFPRSFGLASYNTYRPF